jgi:hypothetical protein
MALISEAEFEKMVDEDLKRIDVIKFLVELGSESFL